MSDVDSKPVLMTIAGVAVHPEHDVPTVILRGDRDPKIILPIAIGSSEAAAIALALTGTKMARPLTHDLLAATLTTLGRRIVSLEVSRLEEGIFYGLLRLVDAGGEQTLIDCRPSDGIALAARFKAPVYVADDVLAEAGSIAAEDEDPEEETGSRALPPSMGIEVSLEDLDPELFGNLES